MLLRQNVKLHLKAVSLIFRTIVDVSEIFTISRMDS